jgi:GH15 family glucan-1,4-alpha-glucosidase
VAGRIEDYAVIGNCETAALVGRDGSIDWLCLPRFDSAACFSALLGNESHGRWLMGPDGEARSSRRYRHGTMILDTVFETSHGAVMVTDFMSRSHGACDVLRRVTGLRGSMAMRSELLVRFDFGAVIPWLTRLNDGRLKYVAGPDRLVLQTPVVFENKDFRSVALFSVTEGETLDFVLGWSNSFRPIPGPTDVGAVLEAVNADWTLWTKRFAGAGPWSDIVLRSLITLKALTHFETGGVVAAVTTSLPERLGGTRNWDYRYCWLRDAPLTLYALMESNFIDEADAWQKWLLRAIAGSPDQLQIMYGVAGERRLDEWQIPWLPGYEHSTPVRVGNAASGQVQLDIYGEVMDALYLARQKGLAADQEMWGVQREMIGHLEKIWEQPDDGIWEVRGGARQFTHSKVMAWVAVDRAIRTAEEFGLDGPLDEWRHLRDKIHTHVCTHVYSETRHSFVQFYGGNTVDASLLMIALVGFLPADDPRVIGTISAIERDLVRDGFVRRYETDRSIDGLPAGEGAFLACSFWLSDNYVLLGRTNNALEIFNRVLSLCNDVGLLAEEYDVQERRQVGNFPQAFSHVALINTAFNLLRAGGPAVDRSRAVTRPAT